MNINWKLRLKNKTTLITLCVAVISAVYSILAVFGIVTGVSQDEAVNLAYTVVNLLCVLGIVVDPTTAGVGDSVQAMEYEAPKAAEVE